LQHRRRRKVDRRECAEELGTYRAEYGWQWPHCFHLRPRTKRPGFAPVSSPSLSTCTPLTKTWRTHRRAGATGAGKYRASSSSGARWNASCPNEKPRLWGRPAPSPVGAHRVREAKSPLCGALRTGGCVAFHAHFVGGRLRATHHHRSCSVLHAPYVERLAR
jgi:hypothetical protein